MLTRSKQAALQEIRRWTIEDVLAVLEKNGLGDCADVIRKREVVGEMLLQLTEGKLALWKRDINQSKIRALAALIEDLKMHPEKYLLKENCSCDPEHFPERGVSPSHVHCNSTSSDTLSRVQDTNSRHDKERKLKVAAAFLSEVISQSGVVAGNSHDDLLPAYRLKPPDKPPILSRPNNFQAGIGKVTANKVFPPKPPNHSPYETTHFPGRDLGASNVSTDSSDNDTGSLRHKSEEDNKQPIKTATSPSTRSISQVETYVNSSHEDSLLQDGEKCPNKPAVLKKPINLRPNASTLHDKVLHLKPHHQQSSKPKNFPARDVQPSHVTSSSSSSDSVPQDAVARNKQEPTVQEAAPITLGNISQSETTGDSQKDSPPSDGLKLYEKPPSMRYPKEAKADQTNTTSEKELLPKPPSHPNLPLRRMPSSSSGSDTASWDTDFEDAEPPKEVASVCPKGISQSEAVGNGQMDVERSVEVTSFEKSPQCSQHSEVQADVISSPSDEMLLPKPPSQSSEIISTVNIGAIEAKIWAEQLDEEFYESLDGENIADVAALRAAVLNQSNEKKSGKKNALNPEKDDKIRAENNHQNGISCTDSVTTTCTKRASLPPMIDIRENPEAVRPELPPTPPPRNPTMKLNEADAVMNRLHSSSSSLREESLRQRSHFLQSPETDSTATSHQSSMTSLNNLNTGSTTTSYLRFSQSSLTFPEQNSDAEYEILDNRARITSDTDSILSEVYESIKEQGPRNGIDEDGYYLQPDPRLPKNDESSSDDSRHLPLPLKSKATLPDVVLPSAPPPSPPRKKSEDSSSSTTSGSGDSMSGRLGGLFRKVISRPQPLLPDHSEKVSPATPEQKKACSLPPPTTRPPPPVEQRSAAFQRPLPPTPEGKKFQLPSPDKTHNTTSHQTTPVSFRQMPWFHNIDRQRAEELLRNGEDGCFVVRPSTQTSNPLTLTLWYKNRIFNICIRHRKDGKYALGTEKINEQSFDSIEEMVTNYQSEKLVLYSAGERAGKVLLTSSPRRSS